MKKFYFILAALLLSSTAIKAQNLQVFYDFGDDRRQVTTTFEMFKSDSWGNTFTFIDMDYTLKDAAEKGKNISIGGAYWEIARCLNFWQNSKASFFSIQVEYNGGLGAYATGTKNAPTWGAFPINHAFLTGADFFVHSKDFNNLFNFKVLYKKYISADQALPMQFTFVWTLNNLFGAKGLTFSGFADYWWQEQFFGADNTATVFLSEPQLWYCVGQHFGCPNLNIGGEVELAYNFPASAGFKCRPCLGVKWNF